MKNRIVIQIKDKIPTTHEFEYRGKRYPINFEFFKKVSIFFSKNESKLKSSPYIELIDDGNIDLTDEAIQMFINYVHHEAVDVDENNIIQLFYLANQYQISPLIDQLKDAVLFKSLDVILMLKDNPEFQTSIYEQYISNDLMEFINDERMLYLDNSIIYRLISQYHSNHPNLSKDEESKISDFFMKLCSSRAKELKATNTKENIIKREIDDLYHLLTIEDDEEALEMAQNDQNSCLHPTKQFDELVPYGLPMYGPILQPIDDLSFFQPFLIQCKSIILYQKKDFLAQYPSGSGKTLAFIYPIMMNIDIEQKVPQVICLSNSIELSKQTFDFFKDMNMYAKFSFSLCIDKNNNDANLNDSQILFGTSESLNYLIKNGFLNPSTIHLLIIDEVDSVLDENEKSFQFASDLIENLLPKNIQFGFFSSTLNKKVVNYIDSIRNDITKDFFKDIYMPNIEHWYTKVEGMYQAKHALFNLCFDEAIGQTIVFVRSNVLINELVNYLTSKNVSCKGYSLNFSVNERFEILQQFKANEFKVLISTDVLAYGIDFPNVKLVVNFQTPVLSSNEDDCGKIADIYVHRSGRTGRNAHSGVCFTIVMDKFDEKNLKFIFSKEKNDFSFFNMKLNYVESDKLPLLKEIE